ALGGNGIALPGDFELDLWDELGLYVKKSGIGTPVISVENYFDNPVGVSFNLTALKYVDLYISNASGVDYIYFKVKYNTSQLQAAGLSESDLRMEWWNGSSWIPCTAFGINATGNYVWVNITKTSTPSLSDLTGTVFGLGGSPPQSQGGTTATLLLPSYKTTELEVSFSVSGGVLTVQVNASALNGEALDGRASLWIWKELRRGIYGFTLVQTVETVNGTVTMSYQVLGGTGAFLVSFKPDNHEYAPTFYMGGRPIWFTQI
ncbi:MAG: hypothetical protein DRG31_07150, partial [Deltaproteobacteria bacterium]